MYNYMYIFIIWTALVNRPFQVLGGSMSLNGSRLLGALVDFSVAKSAPFFLGSDAWLTKLI